MKVDEISRIDSEAGIISSLVYHPEFYFYSEGLLPQHFYNRENGLIYAGISNLSKQGIVSIDAYNIMESLVCTNKNPHSPCELSIEQLNDFIDNSEILARHTVEEYKLLVDNVKDAAFRRNTLKSLKECESMCFNDAIEDIEHSIYNTLDGVMMEFSSIADVPEYKDVVDKYWDEIKSRQGEGYAGIPFKFPTLNNYVTIERGELAVFVAEQKMGKSMILLNCAIELLKQGYSVLYLDSELSTRMFTARILSHLSGVKYMNLKSGKYSPEEEMNILKAKEWMKTRRFTHTYIPTFDIQSIYTTVKRVKHSVGLDVIIVDYFKSSGDGDAFNSYQELGKFVDKQTCSR